MAKCDAELEARRDGLPVPGILLDETAFYPLQDFIIDIHRQPRVVEETLGVLFPQLLQKVVIMAILLPPLF